MMFAVSLKLGDAMRSASQLELSQHAILALRALNRTPGLRQADLARTLSLSASRMSRLASGLEASGLLTRRPHGQDLRSKSLHPTGPGREAYARMRASASSMAQEIFRALPDEDVDALSVQAEAITAKLRSASRSPDHDTDDVAACAAGLTVGGRRPKPGVGIS